MPIYEYSCAKCGKTIETIQKMSDKPLKTHAGCGGKLTKLISASGFQFKGTGWYVTDYARKGQSGESEQSKDAKSDAAARPAETTAGGKTEGSKESSKEGSTKEAAPDKSAKSEKSDTSGKSDKSDKPAKTKTS